MSDANEPLVFPIAHYVGRVFDSASGSVRYDLRGGWSIVSLTENERAVWAVAHGMPEAISSGLRWSRLAVIDSLATSMGAAEVSNTIDELLSRDVLVEVGSKGSSAVDFASKYRLVPMQIGLGNTESEPWAWSIGIGTNVLATVSGTVYHIWKWSHLYRSLWDSCKSLANLRATDTELAATSQEKDPKAILNEVIEALHVLLAANCAYLDVPHEWGKP